MNEHKIRLITDKASEWCKKNAHGAPAAWEWEYKFAELLIRECAQIANISNQSRNRSPGQSVGDVIKHHFGIES